MTKATLDPWRDILGMDLEASLRDEVVVAYESVLAEIKKLRDLNLSEIHPAIVFEPTAVYRNRK